MVPAELATLFPTWTESEMSEFVECAITLVFSLEDWFEVWVNVESETVRKGGVAKEKFPRRMELVEVAWHVN